MPAGGEQRQWGNGIYGGGKTGQGLLLGLGTIGRSKDKGFWEYVNN